MITKDLNRRFWSKVNKVTSTFYNVTCCHEWTASVDTAGYGQIRNGKLALAHRLVWEMLVGPIPDGEQVLHRCDNRRCVNQDHLFLGTNDDNIADKVAKGRASRLKGATNGNSKLTDTQVLEIRTAIGSQRAIARQYGVNQRLVWAIKHKVMWSHI
jgi:hypothetical protein